MKELIEQTVAIVGCSQGLGFSLATSLSNSYSSLLLFDKSALTDEAKNKLNPKCKVSFKQIDVTKVSSLESIFAETCSEKIDHLIYCVRAKIAASIEKMTESEWDLDFATNLKGAFFTTQKLLPYFNQVREGSSITFVSSISSELIGYESASYHSSKAGLNHLIRYLAVHLAAKKIRVNGLEPGFIVQNRHTERYFSEGNSEYRQLAESCIPLQRNGYDSDLVGPLKFLLSNENLYMTGQLLVIDGGMSLQDQFYVAHKALADQKKGQSNQ
ncbi:MAG: SDR family oxidoreductase [Bdellovibrionaceae bacterium]|nr:SDR family oxidoreductase [Bdellovibrio sp.]